MNKHHTFEVIIIGGSYAGLSAAMALGRSLRNVLIIDSALPCNRQTPYSHNFITQDGEKPAVIALKAKADVLKYGSIKFLEGLAASAMKTATGFTVTTQAGETFETRKLIFATGINDTMPGIKGFAACWGISVVHCPYCHGYEIRNQKTGILANGPRAMHLASLVKNLTADITIFTLGTADFTAADLEKLSKHKIKVVETKITEIVHQNGVMTKLLLEDGSAPVMTALYAALPFTQHCDLPQLLGCELTETGYIAIDGFQKTTVSGIYACGDNAAMMRSVANAVYTGNFAGAWLIRSSLMKVFSWSLMPV